MTITVHFANVDHRLHLSIRTKSIVNKVKMGIYYNKAMEDYSKLMKGDTIPMFSNDISTGESARVEGINSETYKQFKITCIQKDISISQGINLALKDWLENQNDRS